MYVRWKRRNGTKLPRWEEPRDTWSAVLVENKRVGGKPCQRVVKYLGSFQERLRGKQWIHLQNEFWQKVTPQLDALSIDGKQREQIESQLSAVVTHSPPEVVKQHWREILESRAKAGVKGDQQELEASCSV